MDEEGLNHKCLHLKCSQGGKKCREYQQTYSDKRSRENKYSSGQESPAKIRRRNEEGPICNGGE